MRLRTGLLQSSMNSQHIESTQNPGQLESDPGELGQSSNLLPPNRLLDLCIHEELTKKHSEQVSRLINSKRNSTKPNTGCMGTLHKKKASAMSNLKKSSLIFSSQVNFLSSKGVSMSQLPISKIHKLPVSPE